MTDAPLELARTSAMRRTMGVGALIAAVLVVLGVGQGLLWASIAPGQQVKVFADGSYGSLPTADYHPFVGLALFVLIGVVVGCVAAAAAWQVRAVRGTATLLAVGIGCALGAYAAYLLGSAVVSGVDPATVGATGKDSIVIAAPRVDSWLALLAQPAIGVAVYTFLVAWNGRPRLGRADVPDDPPPR